jgi:hypothetical protein
MPDPQSDFAENLAASQGDKVVASSNAEFSEIRFDYPDSRDGYENSRYVALCISGPTPGPGIAGSWRGRPSWTPGPPPIRSASPTTARSYYHEKGQSADGSAFAWFIETADQLLDIERRPSSAASGRTSRIRSAPVTRWLPAMRKPT